jgi:hypothetical protein
MTDQKETSLEYTLTNSHKDDLISYIKSHQDKFPELIKLSISDKQPYSWRAAWLLWSCMDNNDKRIRRHIKKIIDILPDRKDNQQRELLMVLQRMELDTKYEGHLFDSCTKIWKSINKNPSLRFNAFKIMVAISKRYPDLSKEIKSLTDTYYIDNLTDNVKKSIFKLMTNDNK